LLAGAQFSDSTVWLTQLIAGC